MLEGLSDKQAKLQQQEWTAVSVIAATWKLGIDSLSRVQTSQKEQAEAAKDVL